jgi:hypothetical protein
MQETLSTAGSVITAVVFVLQPFASVTVQPYVPLGNPEAVAPLPPIGVQVYVKGPAEPDTEIVADPSLPPLQLTGVVLAVALSAGGCEILVWPVALQPVAEVTVTLYVPGLSPDAVGVPCPIPGLGFQE